MNQLYKKENYIIIPVGKDYIVINIDKPFKESHTHVKSIGVARLLIDLAIDKKLPKNPRLADRLIRISVDKEYIDRLKEFKEEVYMNDEDFEKMMQHDSYKRINGAIRRR